MKTAFVSFAHLVPQIAGTDRTYGVEPSGGTRTLQSGVRLVNLPNGAVMSADEAFAATPKTVVEVPDRMGGGFLYLLGSSTVWRSDRWLGHARPLFESGEPLNDVVVGLDRIYLESGKGSEQAIDPRTGAALDLGAWPPAPSIGAYAAMDGWRAVAAADLRGVIATFDAGASWRPLPISLQTTEIKASGNGVIVTGIDTSRATVSYEVRPDGQVARLGATQSTLPASDEPSTDSAPKPFGDRPLLAAVEDGWPLTDGTVVVARDGALARIRLDDGVVIEQASNAYPLRPSRCHAIAFGDGAGFVCGEPRGRSAIYRYESGKMIEARHFDSPRQVVASGTGAVAVRGSCDPALSADDPSHEQSYCLIPKTAAAAMDGSGTREIHLRGNVDQERVAVLSTGKLVVISPPHGDLGAARITVIDEGGQTNSSLIRFAAETSRDSLRALRNGLWLDGLEERRPGVLGGWVDFSGSVLGVEIELDGRATAGTFIRDAGLPVVSGRFGLGWSASRRGYETIDGGMTWKTLEVPEQIAPCSPSVAQRSAIEREARHDPICVPRGQVERSCGPVGCVTQGWLRVGWGLHPPAPVDKAVEGPRTFYPPVHPFALTCEPTQPAPKLAATILPAAPPTVAVAVAQSPSVGLGAGVNPFISPSSRYPGGAGGGYRAPPLTTLDWTPFFSSAAPTLRRDDVGYSIDAPSTMGQGSLLRFYAWGARGTEWERTSRWVVRWLGPFATASDVHSTQPSAPPSLVIDSSHFANAFGVTRKVDSWTMIAGDDPQHALLIARRQSPQDTVVFSLEADHPPIEIRRSDGEAFDAVDAAIRMRGRWFLASPSEGGGAAEIVLWEADGATAHEFITLPRELDDDRTQPIHLAARSDGRALGVLVEGEPLALRPNTPIRWALAIDADDATVGALEPLGAVDFGDRKSISLCNGDEAGWIFDAPWPMTTTPITMTVHGAPRLLRTPYARVRATTGTLCIERLSALLEAPPESLVRPRGNPPHTETQSIDLTAITAHLRYGLRCTQPP